MGSELDFGVVFGMGECTEFHIDGVRSEFGFGSFPEMSVGDCVPLHPWCMAMCGLSQPAIILSDALPGVTFETDFPQDPGMDQPILFGLSNMGGGHQAQYFTLPHTFRSDTIIYDWNSNRFRANFK